MKFIEYLESQHAKQYSGTDDDMSEDFEAWLEDLDKSELIEYAQQALEEK